MADLWIPSWEHVPYVGLGGGSYTDLENPKLLWHTWEGDSWAGAESVGGWARYPPHCGAHREDRLVRQYVPLNKSAYSLANTAAEHEYVIQVEVNGFARETQEWSDDDMDWLRSAVLEPIQQAVGVPRIVVPQGFHGEGEGIVLATKSSPIRFGSVADLRGFSGHMGHQHSPGDEHWDPGRFRIDYLLGDDDVLDAQDPIVQDIRNKLNAEYESLKNVVEPVLARLDLARALNDPAKFAAAVAKAIPMADVTADVVKNAVEEVLREGVG